MPTVYKYENYTIRSIQEHYEIIAPNGLYWGSAESKNEAETMIDNELNKEQYKPSGSGQ